ncbi:uncharacterized protein LOC135493377 [Lineus longissimus]|uniref:uncharacterized protein LOC135493377 n=1 Tax=Lineus longissimus TaxID=88925 RepID=UPI002B4D6DB8
MATGHIVPGRYPISDLRRAKSAHPLGLKDFDAPMDQGTLAQIRRQARDLWSMPDREKTTYNFFHNEDQLQGHAPPFSRPTSPTRKNKPHPPLVFLSCRLHNVPGYHNADTTIGKDTYRVDGSVPAYEQDRRDSLRRKYAPRPHTAAIMPFKSVDDEVEPEDSEGWQKLAGETDKIEFLRTVNTEPGIRRPPSNTRPPALRGYLKKAGYTEAKEWIRYQEPENAAAHRLTPTQSLDFDLPKRRPIYQPVTRRGDYLVHPCWPPTLKHHRLPCLC